MFFSVSLHFFFEMLPLSYGHLVFFVNNDDLVNALEHLMEILLHIVYVLDDSTHFNDLLITEEVESREPLPFVFNIAS